MYVCIHYYCTSSLKDQYIEVPNLCHSAILLNSYAFICELALPIIGKATLKLNPPGMLHM